MPTVRIFEYRSTPTEEIINDVEMAFAPAVGDIVEFETEQGEYIRYEVMKRVHGFATQGKPGQGMLAIGVKEMNSPHFAIRRLGI